MARMTRSERLAKVHQDALVEFGTINAAMKDERFQCLADRRFYSIQGAQWEGSLTDQYENKPKFEVNKVALAVTRIINEYRNNRITVDFLPKDGSSDQELADTCCKLYRADEDDSGADEAYDNAFEEAVGGGFGAWRLRTVYEDESDEDNEKQRIRFEPIFDADSSVFFDLDAKRQDKADAKTCYVLISMTPEAYRAEFDDDPTTWNKNWDLAQFDWNTPDVVYVAEVYKVEEVSETLRIFLTLDGEEVKYTEDDFATDETLEEMLLATGHEEIKSRKIKKRRVHKYLMSGGGILEDYGYIAGDQIPVIPVYGKRWFIDNVERCQGHVRLAKDAQRLKNMQLSRLGEISATSTVQKPIFTPEQVAGHEILWSEDNVKNYPYLLINPITNADGQEAAQGALDYTRAPEIPPAMAALLQITEQDMKEILGNQEAGEKIQPNASGKAVELVQNRLDMQTFIYMSNMAKAVKRCGEIWLSIARDLYVEQGRKMKGVGDQNQMSTIELAKPMLNPETGALEYHNDLTQAKFDVRVDVGPSSVSKRAATVRALTGMMTITQDPETLQVLGAMAMMNMEGEGIQDVRKYFRNKLLRMGVLEPTDLELEEMAKEAAARAEQPDPQAVLAQALAIESQAKAQKAQADTEYTLARAEETRAKTIDTLAGVDIKARDAVVKTAEQLRQATQPAPMGEVRGL